MLGKGVGKAVYKDASSGFIKKYLQLKIISIQNMPHIIKMIIYSSSLEVSAVQMHTFFKKSFRFKKHNLSNLKL